MLSPARGKIIHVLLTRAPLYRGRSPFSCDLHVLSAPLTFVLSQDQTLQLNLVSSRAEARALACEWSVASVVAAGVAARPRALRKPTRHCPRICRRRPRALKRAYDSVFKVRGGPDGPKRSGAVLYCPATYSSRARNKEAIESRRGKGQGQCLRRR